jgi:transposase-like protein
MAKYDPITKEKYVLAFRKQNKLTVAKFADKIRVSTYALSKWIKLYDAFGFEGLTDGFASSTLADTKEALKRQVILLRIENERLKKGYSVKGGGKKKEFMPIKGKNSK